MCTHATRGVTNVVPLPSPSTLLCFATAFGPVSSDRGLTCTASLKRMLEHLMTNTNHAASAQLQSRSTQRWNDFSCSRTATIGIARASCLTDPLRCVQRSSMANRVGVAVLRKNVEASTHPSGGASCVWQNRGRVDRIWGDGALNLLSVLDVVPDRPPRSGAECHANCRRRQTRR